MQKWFLRLALELQAPELGTRIVLPFDASNEANMKILMTNHALELLQTERIQNFRATKRSTHGVLNSVRLANSILRKLFLDNLLVI